MKLNNVSLPYPVLGNGDDVKPVLADDCISIPTPKCDAQKYAFHIILRQNNADITKLINGEKAVYTCEVTCTRTMLRRCFKSKKPFFDIELGRKEVFGKIEFNCYVTVEKPIHDYYNLGFNEDYGDTAFDMEPGDILAAFPTASYVANLKYEQLKNASSLMVVMDDQSGKGTWFDAEGDKIIVYLPHDMYEQFRVLGADAEFNEMFHASIVFNALTYVLSHYDEPRDNGKLWAQAIQFRIENEPERFSDFDTLANSQGRAYELASLILDDPYRRLFRRIADRDRE